MCLSINQYEQRSHYAHYIHFRSRSCSRFRSHFHSHLYCAVTLVSKTSCRTRSAQSLQRSGQPTPLNYLHALQVGAAKSSSPSPRIISRAWSRLELYRVEQKAAQSRRCSMPMLASGPKDVRSSSFTLVALALIASPQENPVSFLSGGNSSTCTCWHTQ